MCIVLKSLRFKFNVRDVNLNLMHISYTVVFICNVYTRISKSNLLVPAHHLVTAKTYKYPWAITVCVLNGMGFIIILFLLLKA